MSNAKGHTDMQNTWCNSCSLTLWYGSHLIEAFYTYFCVVSIQIRAAEGKAAALRSVRKKKKNPFTGYLNWESMWRPNTSCNQELSQCQCRSSRHVLHVAHTTQKQAYAVTLALTDFKRKCKSWYCSAAEHMGALVICKWPHRHT